MEISLALQSGTTVVVTCDGQPSHTFDLLNLTPDKKIAGRPPQPLAKPAEYGRAVYDALFPAKSVASRMLASELKQPAGKQRLLLVASTTSLEAIAWEYACGAEGGFLASRLPLVRGLAASERKDPPAMQTDLHVVAVAPNPAGKDAQGKALKPLDVDGEPRLLEESLGGSAQVERVLPATLPDLRHHLAERRQRVVHFSGYSGIHEGQAALLFEKEDGTPAPVKGRDLVSRIGDTAFMFVLSTRSADKPAPTEFPNLASALVKWGMPYALGMRFTIPDEAAALLNRALYGELARGAPVEQAVWQVRQQLQESGPAWLVGALALYTSLTAPAAGFAINTVAPVSARVEPAPAPPAPAAPAPETPADPQAEPAVQVAPAAETAVGQVMPEAQKTIPVHLSGEQVQAMAANTVIVLTRAPEKRPEWRAVLRTNLNQAKQHGYQPEIEFFSALMGLMDDVPPSLPADSPYAVVIQAIQNAVSGKAPEPAEEEVEPPKEVMNAVRDLLQAKNPHALRKVIEKRQAQLFRLETQDFLASLAQEAQSTGDQKAMQVLVTYAGILQQCQQIGIQATFEQLNQAQQAGSTVQAQAVAGPEVVTEPEAPAEPAPAIPDGFVDRCVEGLRGGRPEREALFKYLEFLPIPDDGFSALLKAVKLALLGSNPQKLGKDLAGEYAAAWQEIVTGLA
jgi:hypothetical protein